MWYGLGQGTEMVETETPDLVVLDVSLPGSDGFEVLRQICHLSYVPITILYWTDLPLYCDRPFRYPWLGVRPQAK